jgi:glycogen(starch) synthase
LFPPDDPVALAESLAGLFATRDQWDARRNAAREFVERDRNWSSNISRYGPVYHKLTGKPV